MDEAGEGGAAEVGEENGGFVAQAHVWVEEAGAAQAFDAFPGAGFQLGKPVLDGGEAEHVEVGAEEAAADGGR